MKSTSQAHRAGPGVELMRNLQRCQSAVPTEVAAGEGRVIYSSVYLNAIVAFARGDFQQETFIVATFKKIIVIRYQVLNRSKMTG